MHWRFVVAAAAVALVACGGPFSTSDTGVAADGGTTGPAPQVSVVAPDDHHEFEIENEDDEHHGDDDFDIEVHVEHANLADPGRCSGSGACGHLVLLIDGVACGNPNVTSSSRKFKGKLGKCVKVSGQHQIVVQLVDDRGNVLASTAPITVNVTFKGHHGDAQTAPAPGGDDQGEHQGGDDQGGDNHGGGGGGGGDDGSGHH